MSAATRPWALVTGASSGLGVDFARQLAARGHNLALVARRREPMDALAATLVAEHGVEVVVEPEDLAAAGAADRLAARLAARGVEVEVLVNNAGFGLFGDFLAVDGARTDEMLRLNIVALTALTRTFAAAMAARGRGRILLVSSIGAYQATPSYAAYSASKAYVLLFGEALHRELAPRGVTVTVVSPGITATSFLAVSGQSATAYQRMMMMRSADVVRTALGALFAGRTSVVPGFGNKLGVFANRFVPRGLQAIIAGRLMRE